jgi:hypothetical protein
MTDKEQFDNNKKQTKYRKSKIKMAKFLKADINRKLSFNNPDENETINLLQQLRSLEIEDTKIRRNKHSSSFYEFTPVDKKNLGFRL